MNGPAHQVLPKRTGRLLDLPSAQEFDRALRNASPADVIAAALRAVGREHLAVVSSFGTESAALLKVMADVDPAIPMIFLLVTAALLINTFIAAPREALRGVALLAAGLPFYWYWSRSARAPPPAI